MTRIASQQRLVGIGQLFEPKVAAPHRRSRISVKQNASQLARAPREMRGERLIGMGIELAGAGVPLYGGVECAASNTSNQARNRASSRGAQNGDKRTGFGRLDGS